VISSTLHAGSDISRGALLARVQQPDGQVTEIRSPLPGRISEVSRANGAQVNSGETILTLNSDEESIWEALRGLSFVGTPEDSEIIRTYANSSSASERVREQAKHTAKAIETRAK